MNSTNLPLWKYEQALYYDIFVKEEYGIAKSAIQEAKIIFDIWGHIGLFSEWCLNLNPQATIHYFEPFEKNWKVAEQRLKPRNDAIIFNHLAIAPTSWNQTFFFNSQKTMQSSKKASFLNPKWEAQTVHTESLDQYILTNHITTIDLMKLDIEGEEFEVLKSLSDDSRHRIRVLLCEIHLLWNAELLGWETLQNTLKSEFDTFEWIPSPYSEKIWICFCSRNTYSYPWF